VRLVVSEFCVVARPRREGIVTARWSSECDVDAGRQDADGFGDGRVKNEWTERTTQTPFLFETGLSHRKREFEIRIRMLETGHRQTDRAAGGRVEGERT